VKILWLSHFVPYPPRGGSRQRSFNLIRHLAKNHELFLVALSMLAESPAKVAQHVGELKRHCADVEVWDPPYEWRGIRWWAQLALSPLYRHHYASCALWSRTLARRWQQTLDKHPGALVHFDSIDLTKYLPAAHGFRRVLNHHNCESAMAERRAEIEANAVKKAYLRSQARKIAKLEREWCPRVDVNVAVSQLDAERLRSQSLSAHFHVVENGTDTTYFLPSDADPEPQTVIFAGGLSWYPNVSAIRFFTREIWPLLKDRCAGIRLYLAGRSPAESVLQAARSDPAITLISDPEDIRPWVARAAVFVCPIIDGGGTRLKILDALAMGKAVVSTSIGCEGLRVKRGEDLLVADAPEAFADEVARALGNATLRRQLGQAGRALVERQYSWEVIGGQLDEAYRCGLDKRACGRRSANPNSGLT